MTTITATLIIEDIDGEVTMKTIFDPPLNPKDTKHPYPHYCVGFGMKAIQDMLVAAGVEIEVQEVKNA
jgi:hypothetical protein